MRLWEEEQRQRIRRANLLGAVERAGAAIPTELTASIDRLKESEDAIGKLIVHEWRKHPLATWARGVRGLGEHNAAVLVAMLDGDPYIAHPKRWLKNDGGHRRLDSQSTSAPDAGEEPTAQEISDNQEGSARRVLVQDPPFARSPGQLWGYCGVGRPGRRTAGMSQEDALALGKPLLKSRLRLIAESFVKSGNETYRAVYDVARAHVAERTHENPCPQCKAKAGEPWRPGHQHAHALRIVAKRFLVDLWTEAKRVHDEDHDVPETETQHALSDEHGQEPRDTEARLAVHSDEDAPRHLAPTIARAAHPRRLPPEQRCVQA